MFTGIVQTVGRVIAVDRDGGGARLLIDPGGWSHRPREGDSIAVSGCCLTCARQSGDGENRLGFDVVAETLRKTKLGKLVGGDRVNLEASLTPSTPLGGHFVQGHVDGLGVVRHVHAGEGDYRLTIEVGPDLIDCMTPGGSVAIDGVSLTLASVAHARRRVTVALIPTTLDRTTLGDLKPGDGVNIEADVLVKTIVHYLRRHAGPVIESIAERADREGASD